jgi:hybrid cluster-associated redox disulfide protein
MDNIYVNEETLIGEIVNEYPETIEILLGIGMHCLGCPASQMESLAEACLVHGFDVKPVVNALNAKIAENR